MNLVSAQRKVWPLKRIIWETLPGKKCVMLVLDPALFICSTEWHHNLHYNLHCLYSYVVCQLCFLPYVNIRFDNFICYHLSHVQEYSCTWLHYTIVLEIDLYCIHDSVLEKAWIFLNKLSACWVCIGDTFKINNLC